MKTKLISLTPAWAKPWFRPIYETITRLRWRLFPKSLSELHAYWRHPWDKGNCPQDYANDKAAPNSKFLVELISSYAKPESAILEIGCNVGRNLHYLATAGFLNLTGIEISEDAVKLGRQIYPELQNQVQVKNASAEEVLPNLPTNAFNMVFTMAVLEHIHPNSEGIFTHMVRITSHYLITIEDEQTVHWRVFPRNYQKVFESLGLTQTTIIESPANLPGFIARVFEKASAHGR